ncbi:exodeoxyribonuclease VIII [Agromyces sp. 3263]|nr:exodeoxyribonuclease VIII [Agromyces sp. 3263]
MIVHDLSDAEYHRRPELSSTGARLILDSPAKYKYRLGHETHSHAFDIGKAVHARVLGVGAQAVAYPDDVLASNGAASTAAAREWAEAARADGLIPMKASDLAPVKAMSEALLAHTEAREILETATGREVSIFADVAGVPARARYDIYGATTGADVKTAADASPDGFNRAVAAHGLHVQEAWYRDVRTAETGEGLDWFKFVVVEKTAPYLVGVYDLDIMWRDIGRERAATARETWLTCTETGVWPGYGSMTLSCPTYVVYEHETRYEKEIQL